MEYHHIHSKWSFKLSCLSSSATPPITFSSPFFLSPYNIWSRHLSLLVQDESYLVRKTFILYIKLNRYFYPFFHIYIYIYIKRCKENYVCCRRRLLNTAWYVNMILGWLFMKKEIFRKYDSYHAIYYINELEKYLFTYILILIRIFLVRWYNINFLSYSRIIMIREEISWEFSILF